MSAASTAMSAPDQMAMQISALANAGKSFTPSPTIATALCCDDWSSETTAALYN